MDVCEQTGPCSVAQPFLSRLVGEDVSGLLDAYVALPEHPMGARLGGQWNSAAPPTATGLRRVASWGGCFASPSGYVLVRGILRARARPGPVRPSIVPSAPQSVSRATMLKLLIGVGGESVLIDADSEVVMPVGPATVHVLAPEGWANRPENESVEATNLWADLAVTACPCECGYQGSGVLTWMWQTDFGNAPNDSIVVPVPRRARHVRLEQNRQTGAIPVSTSPLLFWAADAAGLLLWGSATFSSASIVDNIVPAFPFVRIWPNQSTAGAAQMLLRWGIV